MNTHYAQLLRRAFVLVLPLALATAFLILIQTTLAAPCAAPRLGGLTPIASASDANRDSYVPSMSADGRVVAFESDSDLLNEGGQSIVFEIWLYDTVAMTYTRVTSASEKFRESHTPSLSADGTVVAFTSDSDLLNEGRPGDVMEVWLYDTATMTFTRVTSVSHANRDCYFPNLSGNGTVVAFSSDSDLLNEGRPDDVYEIWLYDTATMTYTRVTSASDGLRDSYYASLNADGTVVAFHSDSDLLNEGISDGTNEVWLYDTATMTFTRVTSASDSLRNSTNPSLSADGTVLAFQSDSDFLNEGRPDSVFEIWLYDTATMTFSRLTSASDGLRDSINPSLNGSGTMVAFQSDSDFLNEGRLDDANEIWLWEEHPVYLPLVVRQ
jgi:Tol biopolymer transport system component